MTTDYLVTTDSQVTKDSLLTSEGNNGTGFDSLSTVSAMFQLTTEPTSFLPGGI